MPDHNFVVGEHAFVLDSATERALPVIIIEVLTKATYPECAYDGAYKVKLDETDAVQKAESYNGYAKTEPFRLHENGIYRGLDVFVSAVSAYDHLIDRCKLEEDELKRRLERLPYRIERAVKRMNIAGKAAGSKYDNGTPVWVFGKKICDYDHKIVQAEIERYDRSGCTDRPYLIVDKKYPNFAHCNWLAEESFFLTRAAAVKALKKQLKAEYDKQLAAVG